MGKLRKAMHATRDAPQIWGDMVKRGVTGWGFAASEFHPSVYSHQCRAVIVVVLVDAFSA